MGEQPLLYKELKRAAWIEKLKENLQEASGACKSHDMRALLTSGFAEKQPVEFPLLVQIQELLVLAGYKGLDDSSTEIKGGVLEAKNLKKPVLKKCQEIAKYTKARPPRATTAVGAIRHALAMIGYQLKRHQRTKKKVPWYNVEPKQMTADLLPWAEFKLEAISMPEKKCPFIGLEHATMHEPQLVFGEPAQPQPAPTVSEKKCPFLELEHLTLYEPQAVFGEPAQQSPPPPPMEQLVGSELQGNHAAVVQDCSSHEARGTVPPGVRQTALEQAIEKGAGEDRWYRTGVLS